MRSERLFKVKYVRTYFELKKNAAAVPQSIFLEPTLFLLYTNDILSSDKPKITRLVNVTAIVTTGINTEEAKIKLQTAIHHIVEWTQKRKIKLNEAYHVQVHRA